MKLSCIVLDDSALQRIIINKLINENPFLKLIGDFSNYKDARICIQENEIDLVFLDVEMPYINGFDFIDLLKSKPIIIFVSAKKDYALKAFDYNAIDFLHKPLSKDRFNKSVEKALFYKKLSFDNNDNAEDFVFIKSNLKSIKISLTKIKWIEAFGDYVKVNTEIESHMVLSTMKSFEDKLPKNQFFRVHKSYIINLQKIERYSSKYIEIDSFRIPLSRNKKDALFEIINAQ